MADEKYPKLTPEEQEAVLGSVKSALQEDWEREAKLNYAVMDFGLDAVAARQQLCHLIVLHAAARASCGLATFELHPDANLNYRLRVGYLPLNEGSSRRGEKIFVKLIGRAVEAARLEMASPQNGLAAYESVVEDAARQIRDNDPERITELEGTV
jgi:hypothetical protein